MEVVASQPQQYTMYTEPIQRNSPTVPQPMPIVQTMPAPQVTATTTYTMPASAAAPAGAPQIIAPTTYTTGIGSMGALPSANFGPAVSGMAGVVTGGTTEAPPATTIVYPPVVDPNFQMPPAPPSPFGAGGFPNLGVTDPGMPGSPGLGVPPIGFPGGFEFKASSANPAFNDGSVPLNGAFQFRYMSDDRPPTDYGTQPNSMGMGAGTGMGMGMGMETVHQPSTYQAEPRIDLSPSRSPQHQGSFQPKSGQSAIDYFEGQLRLLAEGQTALRREIADVRVKVGRNQEHMEILHRELGGPSMPPMPPPPNSQEYYDLVQNHQQQQDQQDVYGSAMNSPMRSQNFGNFGGNTPPASQAGGVHQPAVPPPNLGYETSNSLYNTVSNLGSQMQAHAQTLHGHIRSMGGGQRPATTTSEGAGADGDFEGDQPHEHHKKRPTSTPKNKSGCW
mmetsp:Transcript_47720/g.102236  ORF Transcript_47720/g.102236 Transcript_47720/m.102236 type:complete len:446 (+) Transcript_47720:118-1455(+)